ncbi:hypothetical protein GCM10022233_59450 [Streptomyces shaanxiensis]|uniref:Uncharacterized protein n=1 Tax=Streptomyces shaanxiensis TaxID=653357 RepID=A0ABP7VT25_9ACTN
MTRPAAARGLAHVTRQVPQGRRTPRYQGPATVVFPDGREVAVHTSLVFRLDPATVPDFSYDRHSTWAGSVTLAGDDDVDLFDAAPGILRLPDG